MNPMARRNNQRGSKWPGGPGGRGPANQRRKFGVQGFIARNDNASGRVRGGRQKDGARASREGQAGCAASRYRLRKAQSSIDSDCERSKRRPLRPASGCLEPVEATLAGSTRAKADRFVPKPQPRSKHVRESQLLASSAGLPPDRFAGSVVARTDRASPRSRCGRVC